MPQISRREQAELDELLSDIYKGIETLPDHHRLEGGGNYVITRTDTRHKSPPIIGRAYMREFEVSEDSPLVQRHKQALASPHEAYRPEEPIQKQRSTLKKQTTGGLSSPQSTSLASFMHANPATTATGSTTPDQRRRVRIAEQPVEAASNQYASENDDNYTLNRDYYNEPPANQFDSVYVSTSNYSNSNSNSNKKKKKEKVKYVNTNKLIYHQERDDDSFTGKHNNNNSDSEELDDDDIDGVTRTEFYHTTWLDRQLGRASKRRSSKELSERQVKEKAMIEELKRNLKNGAITLRQSLKGKRNQHNSKHKASDIFDEIEANRENINFDPYNSKEQSQVVKTGIATLPRNHFQNHKKSPYNNQQFHKDQINRKQQQYNQKTTSYWSQTLAPQSKSNYYQTQRLEQQEQRYLPTATIESEVHPTFGGLNEQTKSRVPMQTSDNYRDNLSQAFSRTLPHKKPEQPHQLLQSHYRGNLNTTTANNRSQTLKRFGASPKPTPTTPTLFNSHNQQASVPSAADRMRNPAYNSYSDNQANNNCPSPANMHGGNKSPLQQAATSTISGMPSATEVVRSALSRSNSQVSLNQLNKTINLLPTSQPAHSPMTPTQQLKAASPSLSPSPVSHSHHQLGSKTLGHQQQPQQHYLPGQTVVSGTRTVGRPPQPQQQQPVYANPHASLMQHRMEQQAKQPNRNVASIREFNELDSLLHSLSPGMPGSVTTHITPGFSNKPPQASLGGYMPANYQPAPAAQPTSTRINTGDLYARVQKPAAQQNTINYPQQQHQHQLQHQQQQQQPIGPGFVASSASNPGQFTIDVSDKKLDENCVQRQCQDISEFETPIELLPTMEDYQNITKLNPVKNHYWYKPNMSRELAIHLLKDKPQGTFIVRDSTSFKGAYGLAVKVVKLPKNILANLRNTNGDQSAEFIRHFLIEPTGSGVRLKGYANEPVFDSLPDLIYQHSLTELALPCRLIIPRADIEDPQFNKKQKQFFDEFIASKEHAKHQPYERTSPDGGYRRYPGDVLVHNEHRIIFQ